MILLITNVPKGENVSLFVKDATLIRVLIAPHQLSLDLLM